IRSVLFLDDLAAFLADRLVELGAVAFARRLSALASDLFVEAGAIAIPYGVAAFFAGFSHRHFAVDFFRSHPRYGLLGITHDASADRFRRTFQLLAAFGADLFVESRSVLALRRLSAFAADGFIELRAVLGFHPIAAAFAGLADTHPTAGRRGPVVVCHTSIRPPELSAHRLL